MRALQLVAAVLIVLCRQAPVPAQEAPAAPEFKVVAATWEDGKPVVTAGNLGGLLQDVGEYVVHFPEGSLLGSDNAELYRRDKGVLRRVKDDKGEPLRLHYPKLRDFESNFYVESRTGPSQPGKPAPETIWYLNGLKATRVAVNGTPLVSAGIEFCGGRRPHLITHDAKRVLHNVVGYMAIAMHDMTAVLPARGKYAVSAEPADVVVVLDGDKAAGKPATLHVFDGRKLTPVLLKGEPFKASTILVRRTWQYAFVWSSDGETDTLWRYAQGVIEPILMPGGGTAEDVTSAGMGVRADGKLVFSRTSWDDEIDYQWVVGADAPEPVKTADGAHLGGWTVAWHGDGSTLIAAVQKTEDSREKTLWLYDGKKAVPLNGTDSKPLRATSVAIELAGPNTVVRQGYGDLEYRFWMFKGNKNLGPIRREDGKVLQGPMLAAKGTSNGVYFTENKEKPERMFWLPRN